MMNLSDEALAAAARETALHHGPIYGPTKEDAERFATFKDRQQWKAFEETRGVPYAGKNERVRTAIKRVLQSIPDKSIRDFAYAHCRFYSYRPDEMGFHVEAEGHCVFLSEIVPDCYLMGTIKHEVSHAIVGADERAATALALSWGVPERPERPPILEDLFQQWLKRGKQ
jgi:hypothetical protein